MLMKILFLLFLTVQISLQESCHYEVGTSTLDLTKLSSLSSFQSYQHFDMNGNDTILVTYFFHPCNDTKVPVETDGCTAGYSVYELRIF